MQTIVEITNRLDALDTRESLDNAIQNAAIDDLRAVVTSQGGALTRGGQYGAKVDEALRDIRLEIMNLKSVDESLDKRIKTTFSPSFLKSLLSRKLVITTLGEAAVILATAQGAVDPETGAMIGTVLAGLYMVLNVLQKIGVKSPVVDQG